MEDKSTSGTQSMLSSEHTCFSLKTLNTGIIAPWHYHAVASWSTLTLNRLCQETAQDSHQEHHSAHLGLAFFLCFQNIQTQAAAELLVLQGKAARLLPQELVLQQQLLVLQRAAQAGGSQQVPPQPPSRGAAELLTSSSSSTTCCSSSVIRAFFLSRALWAATRFFSFLRGSAAVSTSGRPAAPRRQPPTHLRSAFSSGLR